MPSKRKTLAVPVNADTFARLDKLNALWQATIGNQQNKGAIVESSIQLLAERHGVTLAPAPVPAGGA